MLKFNNKVMRFGNYWGTGGSVIPPVDPYNPLGLPPNTVRVRTAYGNIPVKDNGATYETATLVQGTTDIYDIYKSGTSFNGLLKYSVNVLEVLGANTTGITSMNSMFGRCSFTTVPLFDTSSVTSMMMMFQGCPYLRTVPLFDTSNVTNMRDMFYSCYELTNIPLFNTSKVFEMDYMFTDCFKVESGALALYQQASTQTTPPTFHTSAFSNCGRDTTTGAAELAQIPYSWGGRGN